MKGAIPRTFEAVEWLNFPFENAARFASYVAARKLGVSRARAAMHSLESTGNFAKRGEMTPLVGAWYPFFNASMTGLEQLGRYASKRRTQAVLAGSVMFPMIWAIAAATAFFIEPPQANRDMVTYLTGVISGFAGSAVVYWLGSSRGSADRAKTLDEIATRK